MYCPLCFSNSLSMNQKGVAEIVINKKQLDSGRILYNFALDQRETEQMLEKKIKEFFVWYTHLSNIEPIHSIEINSNSFTCSNHCNIKAEMRFSVIGILFSPEMVLAMAKRVAEKLNLPIHLKPEDLLPH